MMVAIWAQPGASHWLADFGGRRDEGSDLKGHKLWFQVDTWETKGDLKGYTLW